METLPENWRRFLSGELDAEHLRHVLAQVENERANGAVFPPSGKVFHALELTPPEKVRVVLLGQDPYHDDGQAQGLAFSVPAGVKLPPSLRNIFKEFSSDLNRPQPTSGSLEEWARGGVLLLNSVLTVRAHCAGSHRKLGWEKVTDAIIRTLSDRSERLVFILWGNYAISKKSLIDPVRHRILESVHPSPLSAHRGFFGSRPFSQAESYLSPWSWPQTGNEEMFLFD